MSKKFIWIITDTHFNDSKMKQYESRPDNYDSIIIKNWKKYINPKDTVIHLWDVIFDRQSELYWIMKDLPWKKILVRWNHDRKKYNWYIEKWFDFVCDRFDLSYDNKNIIFTHIPIVINTGNTLNIHWHLHSRQHHLNLQKGLSLEKNILISLEHSSYKPIRLDILFNKIIKKWQKKII